MCKDEVMAEIVDQDNIQSLRKYFEKTNGVSVIVGYDPDTMTVTVSIDKKCRPMETRTIPITEFDEDKLIETLNEMYATMIKKQCQEIIDELGKEKAEEYFKVMGWEGIT